MVVAYGLSTTAGKLVNGKKGQVCGSLGEMKEGRYRVFFKGEIGFTHIKPCNLRWISNRDAAAEGADGAADGGDRSGAKEEEEEEEVDSEAWMLSSSR